MTMKREGSADSHVTLKIPRPLYTHLKQVIQDSGFHSVTEFVVYVMRDLVSNHERLEQITSTPSTEEAAEPLSPEEIEAVRKRLQSLGYL
jgi:Arc/MetJ-type ribon-helix-helix transcriptional regulator